MFWKRRLRADSVEDRRGRTFDFELQRGGICLHAQRRGSDPFVSPIREFQRGGERLRAVRRRTHRKTFLANGVQNEMDGKTASCLGLDCASGSEREQQKSHEIA